MFYPGTDLLSDKVRKSIEAVSVAGGVGGFANGGVLGDPVSNPSHYQFPGGVEVIQIAEHLNFCRGSAVKYLARAGRKNPDTELEDLLKAREFLNREIDRLSGRTGLDDFIDERGLAYEVAALAEDGDYFEVDDLNQVHDWCPVWAVMDRFGVYWVSRADEADLESVAGIGVFQRRRAGTIESLVASVKDGPEGTYSCGPYRVYFT